LLPAKPTVAEATDVITTTRDAVDTPGDRPLASDQPEVVVHTM
jgi:hypothetical protein